MAGVATGVMAGVVKEVAEATKAESIGVVVVNGTPRHIPEGSTPATIASFLQSLGIDPRMVVVEHNRSILHDRTLFSDIPLKAGDTLEIVHFVGGG